MRKTIIEYGKIFETTRKTNYLVEQIDTPTEKITLVEVKKDFLGCSDYHFYVLDKTSKTVTKTVYDIEVNALNQALDRLYRLLAVHVFVNSKTI